MKRKIIQIANSTQLVSLPREWAKLNNIKKGDEVEVAVTEKGILVSLSEQEKPMKKIQIQIPEGVSPQLIISALYKGGFDEIHLRLKDSDTVHAAQRFVSNNCVGLEVIEQGKDFLVLKKISDSIHSEFDSVLKRLIIFVDAMSSETYAAAKNNDIAGYKSVIAMDENVNKFAYFCMRMLNKHPESRKDPIGPLYHIIDQLEEIADSYKGLCEGLTKITKVKPSVAVVLKELNEYVHSALHALSTKKLADANKLPTLSSITRNSIEKAAGSGGDDVIQKSYLLSIARAIRGITSPIVLTIFLHQEYNSETLLK
ncbi:phosphate uptake regulator PhoU [Candidatus Woesearchaeota archaeon]|nr:phosphate uptake regulator PhoU [Candidatus Woesearchaeota archaeon]